MLIYISHGNTLTKCCTSFVSLAHRLNACGYSLGALYPPTWMDWPMIYQDNPTAVQPNMVIFMHMILLDWDNRLAMAVGDTALVTPDGCETLTRMGTDLIVN